MKKTAKKTGKTPWKTPCVRHGCYWGRPAPLAACSADRSSETIGGDVMASNRRARRRFEDILTKARPTLEPVSRTGTARYAPVRAPRRWPLVENVAGGAPSAGVQNPARVLRPARPLHRGLRILSIMLTRNEPFPDMTLDRRYTLATHCNEVRP